MGLYKVSRLMKQAQVTAIRPVKKHRYAGGTVHKIAANLLNRQFNPERPMTHWVGDITSNSQFKTIMVVWFLYFI